MEAEHTRAMRLAAQVSTSSESSLFSTMASTEVAISVEAETPAVVATTLLVLDTLRRLPVRLRLVPSRLSAETTEVLRAGTTAIDPIRGLLLGEADRSDVHLRIGLHRDHADIVASPDRHGAHLTTRDQPLPVPSWISGLGITTCAAIACGEVFKRVAHVVPSRMVAQHSLSWCPVTLTDDPGQTDAAPQVLDLDVALIGLGAIGTAVTRILRLLNVVGDIALVDPERFASENLGTYSLGTATDGREGPWKVDLAARALQRHGLRCTPHTTPVEQYVLDIDAGRARWPSLVLCGVDSAVARRETQRLWPDRLIDGATGDTMCGLHDVRSRDSACLMCLFPTRTEGPSAAERLAAATGLSPDILRYGDQPLTSDHLESVPTERRELLAGHLGKPVCGLAEAIGLTSLPPDDYRPSVPFVSQQAACLMVGRLLAAHLGLNPPTFVQYDTLIGPQAATIETRRPSPDCFCQQRAGVIHQVRAARSALANA